MSKHYNLTVTDDNGKSVTTSNTSTEHPEEVLRMMQLAGMQDSSCGCDESIEENEYQPTPANDKLDLDDYSKKSPESISKQPKKLQPSRGDNPLEYSLDENEIFESLMNEFETVDEGKVNPGLQAYLDKKKGKKDDKDDKDDKVEEKAKPDFADIDGDNNKKETMKKAAKDKKEKADESLDEATKGCADCEYMKDETDGEIDTCDECATEERQKAKKESMDESTDNEFACINTDTGAFGYCGKDELHKFTHMMPASEFTYFEPQDNNFQGMDDEMADQEGWAKIKKEESPELARLRKLAGTEKVDEIGPLAVLAPVAKAVGGALIKKGIKGMAARAGATAVASKALSNKNPEQ